MASKCAESSSSASELSGDGNQESYSLKHLHTNKLSHKISKPVIRKTAVPSNLDPLVPDLSQTAAAAAAAGDEDQGAPPQQPPQPPVYNISKNDFRDVVQRLTGAPPRDPMAQPPAVQPPRPPTSSSRLHRIRPPPLAQLTARPPSMIPCAVDPAIPAAEISGNLMVRPGAPMSPLPPLPGVHLAAESPVSAYMRRLRSSSFDSRPNQISCLSPLAPPRWHVEQGTVPYGPATAPQLQSQQAPSPRSPLPYRLIHPVPSTSQMGFPFPQLPLSPTVPSPKP